MSFSVNTNAGAFAALGNLNRTSQSLDVTQSRINTGLKVASAKDNAAVYSIAQSLRGDVAGFRAVNNSLNRATSELDVAIAGAEAISDLLIEMKEKAVAAKDSGLDTASRTALNSDFLQLAAQITSIAENASFNGKNLLTGGALSAITDSTGDNTITSSGSDLTLSGLALDSSSLTGSGTTSVTPDLISDNTVLGTVAAGGSGADSDSSSAQAIAKYIEDNASAVSAAYFAVNSNDYATDIASGAISYDSSTGEFNGSDGSKNDDYALAIENVLNAAYGSGSDFHRVPGDGGLNVIEKNGAGSIYVARSGANSVFTTSATPVTITSPGADAAVDSVEAAITSVNTVLSNLGSTANRVALQQQFTGKLSDSVSIGIGNLVDADLARESANLQAFQTKQQLGLQALSIANQAPQSVLSLFR